MAIAFDAASEAGGSSSLSWTHTPSGTPKGVFVFVIANSDTSDTQSACTYGGVSMTKYNFAVDVFSETGTCTSFFLGSGLPTGAQTVTVTIDSGSTTKQGFAVTVTAAADTQLAGDGNGEVQGNQSNPTVTIGSISGASYAAAGLYSGKDAEGDVTAGSGFTMRHQRDFGTRTAHCMSSTSEQASGDQVIAFTATSDDVAMCAFAIEEVGAEAARRVIVV